MIYCSIINQVIILYNRFINITICIYIHYFLCFCCLIFDLTFFSPWEVPINHGLKHHPYIVALWAFQVVLVVKNLPAVQETQVQSLDWEDTLEKGMTTHSSILA